MLTSGTTGPSMSDTTDASHDHTHARADCHIYEGAGDDLAEQVDIGNRIILLPDAPPTSATPTPSERIRIMWGQRLIDDLIAGRYRALVCAVNAERQQPRDHQPARRAAADQPVARADDHRVRAALRPAAHA